MIKRILAYAPLEFRNFLITEELKNWKKDPERKDTAEKLSEFYKTPVHSTNVFIRLALGIFTFILCCVVTAVLVVIFFLADNNIQNTGIGVLSLLLGALFLVLLEFYVRSKKSYRFGIDDILLYSAYSAFMTAYCMFGYPDDYYNNPGMFTAFIISLLIFSGVVSGLGSIRYNDMLAAVTSWASFVGAVLVGLYNVGTVGTVLIPFVAAVAGAASYVVVRKLRSTDQYLLWDSCLWLLEIISLFLCYCALNYFVVEMLTIELLDMYPEEGKSVVPMGWLFYTTSAIIPFVYIYLGIKQKNRILFRVGLVLVAAAALTFKYYFSTGHHEITLTVTGALIIFICAILHKFLRTDRDGITLKEDDEAGFNYIDAESLVIVQSFAHSNAGGSNTTTGTDFGDGKFGGGGSSDNF